MYRNLVVFEDQASICLSGKIRVWKTTDELLPKAFTLLPNMRLKSLRRFERKCFPKCRVALCFCIEDCLFAEVFQFKKLPARARGIYRQSYGFVVGGSLRKDRGCCGLREHGAHDFFDALALCVEADPVAAGHCPCALNLSLGGLGRGRLKPARRSNRAAPGHGVSWLGLGKTEVLDDKGPRSDE